MQRSRKPKPFAQLSRRRRRDAFIRLKNQIRRAAPILGGKFITHDYLHGRNGWIDAWFLGRKAPRFYNLTLETTRYAYKEAVWDRAWEESYALAPEREPGILARAVKDPKTGHSVIPAREPLRYPEFDNLTRLEWIERQLPTIADARSIQVFEQWSLHGDYAHGIGLHATIDAPFLTMAVINAFIDRFLEGETDHRDPRPRGYRYDEIFHWGLESNALVDPWHYPPLTEADNGGAAG